MAKTIIHKGVSKYHTHCHECGCDFTYEREDVHHNYMRGGDYVSCPHCGHACAHFGESGTRWPNVRSRKWSCSTQGGYARMEPIDQDIVVIGPHRRRGLLCAST